ncbi:MAG TPA: ATPase, partial [Syntrophomonas sp.]|nr:ATPase [Syntrophomonas sp.]
MEKPEWYSITWQEAARHLQTDIKDGLKSREVSERQKQNSNQLVEQSKVNPVAMLLKQFTGTMMLVLLGATVISGIVGAMADALTIMAIVIINCILGFI